MAAPNPDHDAHEFYMNSSYMYDGPQAMAAFPCVDIGGAEALYTQSRDPQQLYMYIGPLDVVLRFTTEEQMSRLIVDNSVDIEFPLTAEGRQQVYDMLVQTWQAYIKAGYTPANFISWSLCAVADDAMAREQQREAALDMCWQQLTTVLSKHESESELG